jgi:tRNA-uridine 2-sulfurtransferase
MPIFFIMFFIYLFRIALLWCRHILPQGLKYGKSCLGGSMTFLSAVFLCYRAFTLLGGSLNQMMNSLGFAKEPKDTRVVVAMSGGVDSSVVAAMLRDEGYDVIGITLQLYDHGSAIKRKGACCAGQDIQDAKDVCARIGIPHYVLDYEKKFREAVIDPFAASYVMGETPIPCVACNQTVKFRDLLAVAMDLGVDCLVTGHYVGSKMLSNGRMALHRGFDVGRDQSYFLYGMTQAQLDFVRFPLGELTKDQTRILAEQYGLVVADKPDSQDICFVPSGHYSSIVQKLRPDAAVVGDIVHIDGRVLGQHHGLFHYTIGQRKGLGIATGEPLYVVALDALHKRVVVGPREALLSLEIPLRDVNWIGDYSIDEISEDGLAVHVRVRSTRQPKPAVLFHEDGSVRVRLLEPEEGVAPGQACVFYESNEAQARILGGGVILPYQSMKNTARNVASLMA